jgi:hypothetical protein
VKREAWVDYEQTADELTMRILALIPKNPHILDMDDPWPLFKVRGFKCDDLGPSAFQASFALGKAKALWKKGTQGEGE